MTGIGLVLVVAVCGTACSFLAVPGPRAAPASRRVVCDATYVAPAIDIVLALAGAAVMVWGATADSDPEGHTVTARDFAVLPGVVVGMAYGISSAYGFSKVADCKRRAARSSGLRGR